MIAPTAPVVMPAMPAMPPMPPVDAPIVFLGRGGVLGVHLIGVTKELRTHYGSSDEAGVLVGRVVVESPAARAGIQVGDLLTHIDGEEVASRRDVLSQIRPKAAGDLVDIDLLREGKVMRLRAEVEERERHQIDFAPLVMEMPDFGNFEVQIDPQMLNDAQHHLRELAEREDWGKLILYDRKGENEELEERLKELEKKLESLSEKLDDR